MFQLMSVIIYTTGLSTKFQYSGFVHVVIYYILEIFKEIFSRAYAFKYYITFSGIKASHYYYFVIK